MYGVVSTDTVFAALNMLYEQALDPNFVLRLTFIVPNILGHSAPPTLSTGS